LLLLELALPVLRRRALPNGRLDAPILIGYLSVRTYYITMRDHPTFRDIFKDDRKLAEEFAKLFDEQWQPPDNLATLPKKSTIDANDVPLVALEA
jgi:hypothetical protein